MFSVVVPVFNHRSFVEEAVESAVADDLVREVLIVDDLSTDGSADLIERFPRRFGRKVRILREAQKSNKGAHERINQLCNAAAGPWISILNSDDVYPPGRLANARHLAMSRNCTFITGALTLIDARSAVIGQKRGNLDPDYSLPGGLAHADLNAELNLFRVLCSENVILTTSNMIFTKSLFERLNGFRDLRYCHDWDFALRACLVGRPGFSAAPLTCYRIHAANTIQEPTPHVDGEVVRLFSRLLGEFRWVMEDRLSVEALKGNLHLGTFIGDAEIGRTQDVRHKVGNASSRTRGLVLIDHEDASGIENVETLKEVCDLRVIDVSKPEPDENRLIKALERAREEFDPDVVYVGGAFGWLLRNAGAIRRVFGSIPVVDEHSARDMGKWRIYYRSKAVHAFDRFIVDSDAVAQPLASQCGVPRNRIDIVYPSVKPRQFASHAARENWSNLMFVSTLTTDGRSIAVLDLARRCRDCGWPDIFTFAGDFPDECLRYASAAVLDNIRKADEGEAAEPMSMADAAIVLSPAMSVSTTLAALSAGRPVLSVATHEAKQLLNEFGAGMTVDEDAGPDLTWRRFVAFRSRIESLGKAAVDGRGRLCERFSKSSRAKSYGEAIARAIRQTSAGLRHQDL